MISWGNTSCGNTSFGNTSNGTNDLSHYHHHYHHHGNNKAVPQPPTSPHTSVAITGNLFFRCIMSCLMAQEHYDASEALSCLLHSSIALHKDLEARPLSLEKCLDTFTAQEDIKEVK